MAGLADIALRPAHAADAAALSAILRPIVSAKGLTIITTPPGEAEMREWIDDVHGNRGVFLIAHDATGAIGFQCVEPWSRHAPAVAHVGEIATFVANEWQGRGVGRALFEATSRAAAAAGYRKLIASIRADNARALAFYGCCGFERVGLLRDHADIDGRLVDEVLMESAV